MHCIHGITCSIYDMSSNVCDITFTICVTSHYDFFYDITHSKFLTYLVDTASHTVFWQHNHCVLHSLYVWYDTQYICVITHNVSILSKQCMYDITSTICMKSYVILMTSHPLFMPSHHFIYNIKSTIYDITSTISDLMSTVSVSSQPIYRWYHSQCIYDMTSSISVTSYPLYDIIHSMYDITTLCFHDTTLGICMTSLALQKTSHPLYHTKSQYLWHHIHFRHDITPTVPDITPTVSLSSQPLHWYHTHFCMTSNPLYVWHHMHYI